MKKIFLFLSVMDFGGQERFVSRLSQMLENEFEVYVVLLNADKISYPIYGKIINLRCNNFANNFISKVKKFIFRCIRFKRALDSYKPVACISFGSGPNLVNLLCKRNGSMCIPSVRGYATAERISHKTLEKWLYSRRADKIICVSERIKLKLSQVLPESFHGLEVVYNGYDCEKIRDEMLGVESVGHELREATKFTPQIVSAGTLRPEKGYWHLIKAMSLVIQKIPEAHLSIIGPDYLDNKIKLMKLVRMLKLEKNVTLQGWQDNPYSFFKDADLYVLSSIREGFPNALVEAMACGLPVIASDCLSGPREILSNQGVETVATNVEYADFGILIPPLSSEEDYSASIDYGEKQLAESIVELLSNSVLREKYAKMATCRAKVFSYESCKKQIKKVIGV